MASALADRHVGTLGVAGIALAGPANLLLRVLDHLAPLRNPANGSRQGEYGGEHRGRDAHGLEDDARIEVDVGEQLALGEVLVVESDPLELEGDRQFGVVFLAKQFEYLVSAFLEYACPGIVILVHAMAEPHEAGMAVLVLRLLDKLRDPADAADLAQHLDHGFVRTAMRRTPKCGDPSRNGGIRRGAGRADQPDGRG